MDGGTTASGVGHMGFLVPRFIQEIPNSIVALFVAAAVMAFFAPNSEQVPKPQNWVAGIILGLVILYMLPQLAKPTPFLYFQF